MKLENRFPKKRAFVTGAASGLGLAICEHLAANEWKLLVADINDKRLSQVVSDLKVAGAEVEPLKMDVRQISNFDRAVEIAREKWGGIDIVFNNAGIAAAGKMEEISIEEWHRVLDTNLWSVIYGCRAFIPMLKGQGSGHIVNTASSAGTLAAAEMANYNVAKAGVVSLSETLKMELSRDGIDVTVICPTVFKTRLDESLHSNQGMEGKLKARLHESKVTAQDIVKDLINAMESGKLYVMTQNDAKWGWRLKRYLPEISSKIFAHLYRNKKWIFAD